MSAYLISNFRKVKAKHCRVLAIPEQLSVGTWATAISAKASDSGPSDRTARNSNAPSDLFKSNMNAARPSLLEYAVETTTSLLRLNSNGKPKSIITILRMLRLHVFEPEQQAARWLM
jgi:hypothetical protein